MLGIWDSNARNMGWKCYEYEIKMLGIRDINAWNMGYKCQE